MPGDTGTAFSDEALYESLVEAAPFGYGLLDAELRVLRTNGALAELELFVVQEISGRHLSEVVSREVWEQLAPALSRALETREPVHLVDVVASSDGASRRWRLSCTPILHDGALGGVHCIVTETTSRWQAEQDLRRSRSDLKRAHDLVPLGSFELKLRPPSRGTWSEGALRIFGLDESAARMSAERLLGEVVHPHDRELFSSLLDPDDESGVFDVEFRAVRPDGQLRHVHSVGATVRDGRGQVKKLMGMLVDVTERRRTAEALRDRELRMRAVLEAAIDGIVMTDDCGRVESFNPAAERMFGYAAEEVLGRSVALLIPEHLRTGAPGEVGVYLRAAPKLPGGRREILGQRKDGSTFPVEVGVSEVHLADGRKYTGILRDLTEHRMREREFLQVQKLEAIGRLASGIAHDFNNLLMGIMGCASIALDRLEEGAPARRFIEEVKNAAARGATLPSQLLSFSRKRDVEPTLVDVNAVVRDVEAMIGRALGEHIDLQIELTEGPLLVSIGVGQLEQALMNLALNARDAMSTGGVLSIHTEEVLLSASSAQVFDMEPGPCAALVVSDTGCGIDDQLKAYVFEPFFTTKEVGQGTGLGLSTVYGLVRGAGGHVELESEPSRGTRVRVLLPRAECEAWTSGGERPPLPEGGTETVLVVEDADLVRLAVRDYLERGGYRVLEAADGEEALAVFARAEGRVDLLITDVVLPRRSGPELARSLIATQPDLQVIYMSAYAPEQALPREHTALAGGPVVILEKPFSEEALLAVVRDRLDDARHRRLTAAPASREGADGTSRQIKAPL